PHVRLTTMNYASCRGEPGRIENWEYLCASVPALRWYQRRNKHDPAAPVSRRIRGKWIYVRSADKGRKAPLPQGFHPGLTRTSLCSRKYTPRLLQRSGFGRYPLSVK